MRLRTQLALAFACLAIVPLALVLPWALSNLRKTLSHGFEARVASGTTAAQSVLNQISRAAIVAVEELADSPVLEEFAKEIHAGHSTPSNTSLGERLMKSRGVSVLSLLDAKGVTLSSGHLPARLGDPDETLFAATKQPGHEPIPVIVEVRGDAGPRQLPALVAARAVDYGDTRIWVIAGTLLDTTLAEQLSQLTGAEVTIASGSAVALAGTAEPPRIETTIDFPPVSRLTFAFSRSPQVRAERGILRAFVLITGVGLLLAVVLGWVVARHLTRPIEALTAATRELAAGELGVSVEEKSTGELAELVGAFNRMSADLRSVTERLISSERTAAWQEVARRLAHEIKNPLTPIQLSAERIQRRFAHWRADNGASGHPGPDRPGGLEEYEATLEECVHTIIDESNSLRRLIDEFSRFARMPQVVLGPCDLHQLMENVLNLYDG